MRLRFTLVLGISLVLLWTPLAGWAQTSDDLLGEVSFATSCSVGVRQDFNRAVALLHSFEFETSRGVFESVRLRDPDCAMAHWGVAMTYYHPLWQPPTQEELTLGTSAAETAQEMPATDRERALIEAISIFYRDYERRDHRTRARAYEEAMAEVSRQYPDDFEAEFFFLLSTLSTVAPTDKSYAVQRRTGARLEELLTENPEHPGALHYIIHSYDFPPLSENAVPAAHSYLEVAASASHALHMSSHIFTQEGMWDESIDANERSAQAAREMGVRLGSVAQAQQNEAHALDYLAYAYLQLGNDGLALGVVDHLDSIEDLNWGNATIAFNAGAVPARYALERRAWDEAAALPPLDEAERAVGNQEAGLVAVAIRRWARAVGAARVGRLEIAEAELEAIARTAEELSDHPRVWARNTSQVLRLEAAAWIELAKGNTGRALELMEAAAALEDQTDKAPTSPGRVLPVHEQLGDLLMELRRPEEALREYEVSLLQADGRFNSYYGAARAARASGRTDVAIEYYQRLLQLAAADSDRIELADARDFLAR